jgi:TPR repeat protein
VKRCSALLFMLTASLSLSSIAQEHLPASTEARLAMLATQQTLTLNDVVDISSKAQSGNREAQYWLALIYEEGRLVPKDFAASQVWMLKSAEQGYAPAQRGMGQIYLSRVKGKGPVRDYGEADRWLRRAATQGDAEAQFWLGTGYEQGWFGVTDYREAFNWLRIAARQGLPDAQFCLGQMYQDGEGLRESNTVAAHWFRRAADHTPSYLGGVWEAKVELANMYHDGRLPRDIVQEYMWSAIVAAYSNNPTDDEIKSLARRMTKAQLGEAKRLATDWINRHPLEPGIFAQTQR